MLKHFLGGQESADSSTLYLFMYIVVLEIVVSSNFIIPF